MLLIVSILLLVASIIPIRALFQIKTSIRIILVLYVSSFGLISFTAEICGFLGLLSQQWFFLFLQCIETLFLWGIWWKKGRPELFILNKLNFTSKWLKSFLSLLNNNFLISFFTIVVSSGYGILVYLIIRVPPNNSDSMHTHLARVIYWLQQGSFEQLTSYSIFAKIYPFNAQLNVLWTVLFSESDRFVGFVQFFAAIISAVAIYGLSRLLNGQRKYSLLISLIWLTFPIIVFQSTSTQFDLVVTALFTTSIYFLFDYYKNKIQTSLFFSAFAFGLSLGTKQTVIMMIPALILVFSILVLKNRKLLNDVFKWVVIAFLSFVILGSYTYINNLFYFQNPLGPTNHVIADSFGNYSFIEKLKFNSPRFLYQFTNFDSLPVRLADKGNILKNQLFKYFDTKLNLQLESNHALKDLNKGFFLNSKTFYNEDESWFGFGAVLLIFPALLTGIFFGIKNKDLISLSLVLFSISFYFSEILLRPGWDPYQGRYFILQIAIIMPLVIHIFNNRIYSKIFQFIICIIVILTFFMAIFSNESKPILGKKAFEFKYQTLKNEFKPDTPLQRFYKDYSLKVLYVFWDNLPFQKPFYFYDDTELRVLSNLNYHLSILRDVNKKVPDNARLGVMLINGDFDYVFFGPKLTRVLINIVPITKIYNLQWLINQEISYVLISNVQRISVIPPYLEMISADDGWGLFSVIINQ